MRRDLIALDDNSKAWVYQSNRDIPKDEIVKIRRKIFEFTEQWKSHGKPLDCYGDIFHSRFLVLVADDTDHVSGCSIDSSVHFIKEIEKAHNIDFFNRLVYGYMEEDHFRFIHQKDFKDAYRTGQINDDTLMVNNLIRTKKELINDWIIPLRTSWYNKMLV